MEYLAHFLELEGFPSLCRRDLPDLVPAELSSRLDHEENLTLKYLSNIRRVRNTIPPISRLPEDVLIQIFILEASSWRSPWGRVRLAHVCHSWRQICLHNALLWTEVHLRNIGQAATFLERSKTAPVRACLHEERFGLPLSTDECIMAIQALEPHANHVSELNVGVSDMGFGTYAFTYPFPRLRKLSLGTVFGPLRDIPHITNFPRERSQPSLDSLTLYNVVMPFDSLIYRGLRELALWNQHTPSILRSHTPSMRLFLQILRDCPQLEYLILFNAGPRLPATVTTYPKPRSIIELPNLKYLRLSNYPHDIAYLLACLVIPAKAKISLESQLLETQLNGLREVLPRDLHGLSCLCIADTALIKMGPPIVVAIVNPPVFNTELCVVGDHVLDVNTRASLLYLPCVLTHSPLRVLTIELDIHMIPAQTWSTVFTALPTLQHLSICQTPPKQLHDAWMATLELFLALRGTPGTDAAIPHLSHLMLSDLCLGDGWEGFLENCLARREQRGARRLEDFTLINPIWVGMRAFSWPTSELREFCEVFYHPSQPIFFMPPPIHLPD